MPGIQASNIKNIIFDLGGVLLNINPLRSLNEFSRLSGVDANDLRNRLITEHIFEKFDTGNLNQEQFRSELCRIMNCALSDSEIDRAWNILLLDFPPQRVQLLKQLKKNYRVFLLSNTNIIHFEYYTKDFYNKYNIPMRDLFDTLFLSYQIGMHKPDAGIYEYVIKNGGLEPSECVFIDDSIINIEAAEFQGIKGIHINDHDVTHYFENGYLKQS
jgi:putative hydrolase of the HAD superfamily